MGFADDLESACRQVVVIHIGPACRSGATAADPDRDIRQETIFECHAFSVINRELVDVIFLRVVVFINNGNLGIGDSRNSASL